MHPQSLEELIASFPEKKARIVYYKGFKVSPKSAEKAVHSIYVKAQKENKGRYLNYLIPFVNGTYPKFRKRFFTLWRGRVKQLVSWEAYEKMRFKCNYGLLVYLGSKILGYSIFKKRIFYVGALALQCFSFKEDEVVVGWAGSGYEIVFRKCIKQGTHVTRIELSRERIGLPHGFKELPENYGHEKRNCI